MKLLKFPYLVQDEILHNVGYSELFLLSFLSKNMSKLIKKSQKSNFRKMVRCIKYDHTDEDEHMVFLRHKHTKYNWDVIMQFAKREDKKLNFNFKLNLFGKKFEFGSSNKQPSPYFKLNVFGRKIAFRMTKKYGQCFPVAHFRRHEKKSSDQIDSQLFPQFLRRFYGVSVDNKPLSSFRSKRSKVIKMSMMSAKQPLSLDSKFYQTESIEIEQHQNAFATTLRHFQGRQAVLTCFTRCKISDLIEFVNRWKSGEAYHKLERLEVGEVVEDQNRMLEAIGAKHIDPAKKVPTHTVPRVFNRYSEPNTKPIRSRAYVVRATDNRVASVLIEEKWLKFGVWDKTEDEFVKMVE
ncbi:hypothetical protein B9Z55_000496 [Caenorhabditis nigoni]|uniref:F-box domain-containing protein n=1 Tax=Caenorhabditis nigoni TaxID=1611254 RepID=A0A2G5VTG5_9PELO|nr:hypothetical protein B9Z55_000496 [Caenorhabditis nigoni]